MEQFTFYTVFWYFAIYSVLGWCTEVCFCTVNTGKFVNRGFLNGPVCPIYGFGMVLILMILEPLQDSLPVLFAGSFLLTSSLELVTGFVLKKLFHTSWWDYTDQPFNIGGYVCLKFSLAWGVGGTLMVRVIHPIIKSFVGVVPHIVGVILLPVVLALFLCDAVVTVMAIAKMNRDLGAISEVAKGLRAGSDVVAKNLGDTALAVDEKVDAATAVISEKTAAAKAELTEKSDAAREKAAAAKAGLTERAAAAKAGATETFDLAMTGWEEKASAVRRRLLKAYPNMKNDRDNEALGALREWYRKRGKKA